MNNFRENEDAERVNAREYWTLFMEQAYEFMQKISQYPILENTEELVSLIEAVKNTGVKVTFSNRPSSNGISRLFYLRKGLIEDFLNIAEEMNKNDFILHVEDAFRTKSMQKGGLTLDIIFNTILRRVIWELKGNFPEPEFLFRRLQAMVASSPKVGTHMSGSALDITVFSLMNHCEIDRGASYLEFSELTPMCSPFIGKESKKNRERITEIFEQFGFLPYPYEFWHYSKGDAYEKLLNGSDIPAGYGPIDFDIACGKVIPIENSKEFLISLEEIHTMLKTAYNQINILKNGDNYEII